MPESSVFMRLAGGMAGYAVILGGLQGHISAYPLCYNIDTVKERKTFPKEQKRKGSDRPPKGEITMKNTNNYTIDIMTSTITLTKTFYKKATSNINNPEYKELKTLLADYPEYEMRFRESKKKESKKTYRNLTYGNMEKYIKASEKNPVALLSEFQTIKAKSCIQPSPYAYVKKWFLEQYPDYTESKMEAVTAMVIVDEERNVA